MLVGLARAEQVSRRESWILEIAAALACQNHIQYLLITMLDLAANSHNAGQAGSGGMNQLYKGTVLIWILD